jgi:hypothetical protein
MILRIDRLRQIAQHVTTPNDGVRELSIQQGSQHKKARAISFIPNA